MVYQRLDPEFINDPKGKIAVIALKAEKRLNVVDGNFLLDASIELDRLIADYEPRTVVLKGRTEWAFVGGANLNVLRELDRISARVFIQAVHQFCESIRRAEIPIIAMLQGYCLGAGLEIAAACDFRIGDYSVKCGMPEVRVGVPSVVEAALLPPLIGWGKARELMLRGNIISAQESLKIGILQHLVSSDLLHDFTIDICRELLGSAPLALKAQKELFLKWENAGMDNAIEEGIKSFQAAYEGDEPERYIESFFSKR